METGGRVNKEGSEEPRSWVRDAERLVTLPLRETERPRTLAGFGGRGGASSPLTAMMLPLGLMLPLEVLLEVILLLGVILPLGDLLAVTLPLGVMLAMMLPLGEVVEVGRANTSKSSKLSARGFGEVAFSSTEKSSMELPSCRSCESPNPGGMRMFVDEVVVGVTGDIAGAGGNGAAIEEERAGVVGAERAGLRGESASDGVAIRGCTNVTLGVEMRTFAGVADCVGGKSAKWRRGD